MNALQQSFGDLVKDAHSGKLRLPEFQRPWRWSRARVLRLFDSIRKDYPIGGFLTLEASDKINLSPRLFEGIDTAESNLKSYVLDGQQRITAGLALCKGTGGTHYFLDLQKLWDKAQSEGIDFDDRDALRAFADDLDEEDEYIRARRRASNPDNLIDGGLLWTPNLTDDFMFSDAKVRYLRLNPDKDKFMERLVWPYFRIGSDPTVSVTELDSDMPVEAITRVFETLNTSGQRLTPVEIVVAVLFAQGIHLRQDLDEFHDLTSYYKNMDSTGEMFLQVVALLDEKNSRRSKLPKTITSVNYTKFRNDAADCLERAGEFLSERFGIGLDVNDALVPYPAMLPPLGIALAEIERRYTRPGPEKAHWQESLERWFVGSVLEQRYTESQPSTQMSDTEGLLDWIRNGEEYAPRWLNDVRIRSFDNVNPTGAIGKLVTCMMSREKPMDPLNREPVGGRGKDISSAQSHHIFPRAFCEQHLPEWRASDNSNLALNVMPLTKETNRDWSKMDPMNQVTAVRNAWPSDWLRFYHPFFLNERCLEILQKPGKTRADFYDFISERGRLVQQYIADKWGFASDTEPIDDPEGD